MNKINEFTFKENDRKYYTYSIVEKIKEIAKKNDISDFNAVDLKEVEYLNQQLVDVGYFHHIDYIKSQIIQSRKIMMNTPDFNDSIYLNNEIYKWLLILYRMIPENEYNQFVKDVGIK